MNMVQNYNQQNKKTIKAGCILVDPKTKKIGLIYRDYRNDYEFAKGHLENGETIAECALRETAEETKIDAEIIETIPPFIEEYKTPSGEQCVSYLFVSTALGKSKNTSTDTHELIWLDIDEVEAKLSYITLKNLWKEAKPLIETYYNF